MVGKGGKGVEDAEVMPVNRINETTKTEIQTQAHTYRHIKYAKAYGCPLSCSLAPSKTDGEVSPKCVLRSEESQTHSRSLNSRI